MTRIEFYDGDAAQPMVAVDAGGPPPRGDLISILGETWRVARITWAVDQPTGERAQLRANVELRRSK
jgi:hypothetical protein